MGDPTVNSTTLSLTAGSVTSVEKQSVTTTPTREMPNDSVSNLTDYKELAKLANEVTADIEREVTKKNKVNGKLQEKGKDSGDHSGESDDPYEVEATEKAVRQELDKMEGKEGSADNKELPQDSKSSGESLAIKVAFSLPETNNPVLNPFEPDFSLPPTIKTEFRAAPAVQNNMSTKLSASDLDSISISDLHKLHKFTDVTANGLFVFYKTNIEKALNNDGLGATVDKTLYRNDKATSIMSGKNKFFEAKSSHTSLIKGGVTISPPVRFHGELMYTMTASTAVLKQVKNVNIAKGKIGFARFTGTNMNWARAGEKSSFGIIANKDRLIAFSELGSQVTMPDLQHPERLKYGEMMTFESGLYATADTELRLQLGSPVFQGGLYGNAGSEHERGKRRVTVRAAKNAKGDESVVISIVEVRQDETHTKIGGIVSTPDFKSDFMNIKINGSYNHETYTSSDMGGSREGMVVELDITTPEGRAAYDSIMKAGKVSPDIYTDEGPALYAGKLSSKSETDKGSMSNTTYILLPTSIEYPAKLDESGGKKPQGPTRQHGFGFSSTTGYQVEQKTEYEHLKVTEKSSMSSKLDIYSAIDGGADMNELSEFTKSTTSIKQRDDYVTYAINMNKNVDSKLVNVNDIYSSTFVNGKEVIDILEDSVSRVNKGKDPVFRSILLKLPDGTELKEEDALKYLKDHASGNNALEDWFFGSDKLSVSLIRAEESDVLNSSKMIAGDAKEYLKQKSKDGRNKHQASLLEGKIYGIDTDIYTDEALTHKLLLNKFDHGKLLGELVKFHDAAKREKSYPIDIVISLPHESY